MVDALEHAIDRVRAHAVRLVTEPFTLPCAGRGCYITIPPERQEPL